ncbi:MAG: hypothetical protein ACRD1Y_11570 [Terriglobales bacterium]
MKPKSQFRLLLNNASRRFARLDGVARNADARSALVLAAIVFGVPEAFLAFLLAYPVVIGFHVQLVDARPILNQLAYYSALLLALAALLEWDALLPQALDRAVLQPLPVSPWRVVTAHAGALTALLGILTLALSAPAMLLIPMLDATHASYLVAVARQAAAVAITAAIALSAVVILRVLGLALSTVPGLRRLGDVLRLGGMIAALTAVLLIPVLSAESWAWRTAFASPLWLAPWAAGLALVAIVLFALASHHALRRQSLPRAGPHRRRWGRSQPGPQAAVASFAARTLVRCGRQSMAVGAWFALGAGVVFASAVRLHWGIHPPTLTDSAVAALSVPLLLCLFLLAGVRSAIAIPVELRANWVFRICDSGEPGALALATRRLMLPYLGVLLIPAAGFAFWTWTPGLALEQIGVLALTGLLWIQALTWGLRKIPFACSYQPGGANLMYVWPIYALGFLLGGYVLASCEQWILAGVWRWAAAVALLVAALLWSEHRRRHSPGFGYQFEDAPEPAVQTLLD